MTRVKVKKSDPPETTEILAEAIVRISDGMELLKKNGMNHRGVVALLHDATKMRKGDIEVVLAALRQLKGWYCRAT